MAIEIRPVYKAMHKPLFFRFAEMDRRFVVLGPVAGVFVLWIGALTAGGWGAVLGALTTASILAVGRATRHDQHWLTIKVRSLSQAERYDPLKHQVFTVRVK